MNQLAFKVFVDVDEATKTPSHHDNRLGWAVSGEHAVVGEQAQGHVEGHSGQIPEVQKGLHQRNGAHGPVAAQLWGIQQQPCVHREQVVKGQLPAGSGTDSCRVIKSTKKKGTEDNRLAINAKGENGDHTSELHYKHPENGKTHKTEFLIVTPKRPPAQNGFEATGTLMNICDV